MGTPLSASLAAGDPEAFAALYDRLAVRLLGAARTMLATPVDAEDVVQDVFVELARGRARLAAVTDLEAYVFTMLRHAVHRRGRRAAIDRRAVVASAAGRRATGAGVAAAAELPDDELAAALTPAPGPDDNAAPLYARAFAALAADKTLNATESPATSPLTADGDGARALADVVRIHRLGQHAASEPLLISGLVGQAIDAIGIASLADVLPRLDKDDLHLLDTAEFQDFLATPVTSQRAFLGEEAFGLATLGDLADGAEGIATLEWLRAVSDASTRQMFDSPLSLLYRCFLLPADTAGYRAIMRRYRAVIGSSVDPASNRYPTILQETRAIEDELESRRPGIFSGLMAPALSGVITSQARAKALRDAAGVIVAATRARLAGASLAGSFVPEVLSALPPDPFAADQPLVATPSGDGWLVYSVGPDGEDDGGPPAPGVEGPRGNDDVGLRLAFPATSD